jgi:hypothetical protein
MLFVAGRLVFVFADDGGGQQEPDQAETGQGEEGDHEDRHGILLCKFRYPGFWGGWTRVAVTAITNLRDPWAVPDFSHGVIPQLERMNSSWIKPATLGFHPRHEEAGRAQGATVN